MDPGGLTEEWWGCAMESYCCLRDVHDKFANGYTAYVFGVRVDGPSLAMTSLGRTRSDRNC